MNPSKVLIAKSYEIGVGGDGVKDDTSLFDNQELECIQSIFALSFIDFQAWIVKGNVEFEKECFVCLSDGTITLFSLLFKI